MSDKYFAAENDVTKTVSVLKRKADDWFNGLENFRYLEKIRKSWHSYHGNFYEDSHSINFGGERGELTNIAVNHYRNIAENIKTMVTASRPSFQAKAINTDLQSQDQTYLANGLLEYYMRDKRLEVYLKRAAEYAIVMGSGFIKMEWNATSGRIYDYIEPVPVEDENGEMNMPIDPITGEESKGYPIYEGDVEFKNLSPFDVVFDGTKETYQEHDWVLTRTFKNKFDLAAKYPESSEKILALKSKSELSKYMVSVASFDETSDVPVYEFYHKRTESMPNGRYVLYLDEDLVLFDSPMPYRKLPVYRISPADVLGTPYGYTSMFDLLPLQDAVNSLYSVVLTNQNSFGVQSILNPKGNDVRINQLDGGMNFIEYNPIVGGGASGKPEALNLTKTPPEIFNYIQMLEKGMETVSGINSVVRGNPEASLKSGNALALIQSQALQFVSGLQQSYIMLIEDIGTGLIQLLQDFASVPRIAEISGKTNRSKMREFKGSDLSSINRVVVDVGNALAQTAAGRTQMADNLIQMGLITTPEDYLSVIATGRLDVMTEDSVNQNLLIKAENERLVDATSDVIATWLDKHSLHIRHHMGIIADPDIRLDVELVQRVMSHIQEHINLLRETDPAQLAMIGEQPLPPQNPPMPPEVSPEGGQSFPVLQNEQSETVAVDTTNQPKLPKPATVDGPSTPQETFLRNI